MNYLNYLKGFANRNQFTILTWNSSGTFPGGAQLHVSSLSFSQGTRTETVVRGLSDFRAAKRTRIGPRTCLHQSSQPQPLVTRFLVQGKPRGLLGRAWGHVTCSPFDCKAAFLSPSWTGLQNPKQCLSLAQAECPSIQCEGSVLSLLAG